MDGDKKCSKNNWARGVQLSKKTDDPLVFSYDTIRLKEQLPYAELPYTSAEDAYEQVLLNAGASLYRDPIDTRIVEEVREGKATYGNKGLIDTQEQVGGFPDLTQTGVTPVDSDGDGMPDEWETANGLNPNKKNDANKYTLSKEYTNIEMYINSLVPAEAMQIVPDKKNNYRIPRRNG